MSACPLQVFVYGTLKSDERNHVPFCANARKIEPATTRGELYELPYGFPGLCVDNGKILASGTADYAADTQLQYDMTVPTPSEDLGTVHGEVITFDDPVLRLPALDGLEGYSPDEPSFYRRVLYPVDVSGEAILAWLYHIPRPTGEFLPDGRWPAAQTTV